MANIKIVKPKLIKTKKYKTIDFVFVFPIKFQRNHHFDLKILSNLLTSTSFEFPLEKDFKNEMLKKLIISYYINITRYNETIFFKVYLTVPNPKDIKDFNLKEAFDFFYNSLYKPNVHDERFSLKEFEREKDFLKSRCKNNVKDIYGYSYNKFMESLDKEYYTTFSDLANLDSLDTLESTDLYKYYQENIYNNKPFVFIYGNVLKKEIDDLFKKYFDYQEENLFAKDFNCFKIARKKPSFILDVKKEYQDSVLNMAFAVKDMKEEDKFYLRVLNNVILRSLGVSLFLKKLRLDNDYVYSVFNSVELNRGLLIVETYIKKDNDKKVIKLIEEVIESLKDIDTLKEYQKKCLVNLNYIMTRRKDEKYALLDETINVSLGVDLYQSELIKKFKDIEIEEFIKFLERVKLDTVYFLRGDK